MISAFYAAYAMTLREQTISFNQAAIIGITIIMLLSSEVIMGMGL